MTYLVWLNVLTLMLVYFLMYRMHNHDKVLKSMIDKGSKKVLDSYTNLTEYDMERFLLEAWEKRVGNFLSNKLEGLEKSVVHKKAESRLNKVVDEFCMQFTVENYEALLKERLKDDVKYRLESSGRERLVQASQSGWQ